MIGTTIDPRPDFSPKQEIRYALVLYGGVSLAIYINGVVQEMLRLVRASAPAEPLSHKPTKALLNDLPGAGYEALDGSEKVYRKLAQYLGSSKQLDKIIATDPIKTRFVIDVLSGTSAGGINAVFLGKALATEASMDDLQKLWIEEASMQLLINDRISAREKISRKLRVQNPPKSLLNGQRMYLKLVEAIMRMHAPQKIKESRLVDELDVFITATDYNGLVLPIQLSDEVVHERRYKNVFHLKYASEYARGNSLNDFVSENDSFLGFCARCTSAFPFAFEPMKLQDTDELQPGGRPPDRSEWEKYFEDYAVSEEMKYTERRPFTDGGVLDNKPFTHAIEALTHRRYDYPGKRKLIFIEPSPESPEVERLRIEQPNAVTNVIASLITLPRYETIREDLETVLHRNRQIQRLAEITHPALIERDVQMAYGNNRPKPRSAEDWSKLKLSDLVKERSPSYAGYYRIKVTSVTSDLAELITVLSDLKTESDEFKAVRLIVRAWRNTTYSEEGGEKFTLNQFLLDFDFSYRLRRLNFVRKRADDPFLGAEFSEFLQAVEPLLSDSPLDVEQQQEFLRLKSALSDVYTRLRKDIQDIRLDADGTFSSVLIQSQLNEEHLLKILTLQQDKEINEYVQELFRRPGTAEYLKLFLWMLQQRLESSFIEAREGCSKLFERSSDSIAGRYLSHFYTYFEDYDMVLFPITYGTGIHELEEIDVVRVCPQNAVGIYKEDELRQKLAGTFLGNFGGFLERLWRENDMLWGRLDGAERIIQSVLPKESPECIALVEEAHAEILNEYLTSENRAHICEMLAEGMIRLDTKEPNEIALRNIINSIPASGVNSRLKAVLLASLNQKQWKEFYKKDYRVNRQLNREDVSRSTARATTVIGKILEEISQNYGAPSKYASWIAWFGRFLWGFVEVSVPRSFGRLIWHHWRPLLFLFEALLFLSSILLGIFGKEAASAYLFSTGVILFTITITASIIIHMFGRWMLRYPTFKSFFTFLMFLFFTLLVVLACIELYFHGVDDLGAILAHVTRWWNKIF